MPEKSISDSDKRSEKKRNTRLLIIINSMSLILRWEVYNNSSQTQTFSVPFLNTIFCLEGCGSFQIYQLLPCVTSDQILHWSREGSCRRKTDPDIPPIFVRCLEDLFTLLPISAQWLCPRKSLCCLPHCGRRKPTTGSQSTGLFCLYHHWNNTCIPTHL